MTMVEQEILALPKPRAKRGLMRRVLAQPRGMIGLGMVALMVAVAVIGPFVAPYGANEFIAFPYLPPDGTLLLGADNLGRDVLSRTLHGGWMIMLMALGATAVAMIGGTTLGIIAGYAGERTDTLVMRGLDVILAFPERVLVLMCVAVLSSSQIVLVVATGVAFIPGVARTARAATMDIVRNEFIEYTRAIGMPKGRVIRREILPNVITPLTVEAGFRLNWSIGAITGISFLGFGTQPPAAEWGLMINESRDGLLFQPWAVAAPVLCIAVFVIGVNLLTDAIARAAGRTE